MSKAVFRATRGSDGGCRHAQEADELRNRVDELEAALFRLSEKYAQLLRETEARQPAVTGARMGMAWSTQSMASAVPAPDPYKAGLEELRERNRMREAVR